MATGAIVGADISGVFVHPQLQKRGIGGQVMDRLEGDAALAGRDSVRLDVSLPSRGFYESRGYRLLESCSIDVGEASAWTTGRRRSGLAPAGPRMAAEDEAAFERWVAEAQRQEFRGWDFLFIDGRWRESPRRGTTARWSSAISGG